MVKKVLTKSKLLVALIITVLCLAATTGVVYAIVLFSFKTDMAIGGNTDTINTSDVLTMTTSETSVDFSVAGEKKDINLVVSNSTNANITYDFGLECEKASGDTATTDEQLEKIKSAVLVYFDREFVGTLADISSTDRIGSYHVMTKSADATEAVSASHTLSLELHIATDTSLLDREFNVKVTTYCHNADYMKYIFVSNESEFINAVNDINTGLLNSNTEKATIVLNGDITIASATDIKYSANIDLNGYRLENSADITLSGEGEYKLYSFRVVTSSALTSSGSITVNNEKAYINIADFYYTDSTTGATTNVGKAYSDKVTLTSFDKTSAFALYSEHVKNVVYGGIEMGKSTDVFGALSCYASVSGASVSGSCTYSNGSITANTITATEVASISLNDGTNSATIEFKIIGDTDGEIFSSLLTGELKHIQNNAKGEAVAYDVFLPKRIEDKNVSIEWTSSDENSISADGKLADTLKQNTTVTLYAKVTINDSVFTTSFTFKVTSQTRETKFKYLVAQLSPIYLSVVQKDETTENTAKFKLPSVEGAQAYTSDYVMLYKNSSGEASEDDTNWTAYKDIGLKKLEYKVNGNYNFITVETKTDTDSNAQSCVYLNSATFYTFAQITVIGTFEDGDPLEETVNVMIKLGDNSDLYELAFANIEQKLSNVDILQNILDTRACYGKKYERGDFYLDNEYQSITITYSVPTSSTNSAITKIQQDDTTDETGATVKESRYHFYIDASKFGSTETSLAIKVDLKANGDTGTGASRVMYVGAPAIIKADENGFANYSVYNSVKYQTAVALQSESKKSTIDDKTQERIAELPAITVDSTLSDTEVKLGYSTSGSSVTDTTGKYILARDAAKIKTLEFITDNTSSSLAHTIAYNFARLLSWATGSVKGEALPFSVGTYSTTSNGKDYMNEDEVEVLQYYLENTVGITGSDLTDLWNSTTEKPTHEVNGTTKGLHIVEDYDTLSTKVEDLIGSSGNNYFKYTEVFQWAINEKNFNGNSAGGKWMLSPPNLGTIGNYNVAMSGGSAATDYGIDWSSSPSSWSSSSSGGYISSKYYNQSVYVEDETEYISDYEAQVIIALWYGFGSGSSYATTFLSCCTIPTYLTDDGAGKLINEIYTKLLGTDGYTAGMVSIGTSTVPEISVLDYSSTGLSYYTALNTVRVSGKIDSESITQPAFITTGSLGNFFNRVTGMDSDKTDKLGEIVMKGCSKGYTEFDLGNIENLTAVTSMDFSYNDGITTIGDLLNVTIQAVQYVDVHKVNVTGDYLTYVLDNLLLDGNNPTIYYTSGTTRTLYTVDSNGATATGRTSVSPELRFLKELTEINGKYLLATTAVDAGDASTSAPKTIQWYVENGNPGYVVTHGGSDTDYIEITSVDDMNELLSNYYIFTENVGTYEKNGVYKLVYDSISKSYILEKQYSIDGIASESEIDWNSVEKKETTSLTQTSASGDTVNWPTGVTLTKSGSGSGNTPTINNVTTGFSYSAVFNSSRGSTNNYTSATVTKKSDNSTFTVYHFYKVYTSTAQSASYTYRYQIDNMQTVKYYSGGNITQFSKKELSYKYSDITVTVTGTYVTFYYATSRASSQGQSNRTVDMTRLTDDFTISSSSSISSLGIDGYTYLSDGVYYNGTYSVSVNGTTLSSPSGSTIDEIVNWAINNSSTIIGTYGSDGISSSVYHNYVTALTSENDIDTVTATAKTLADALTYRLYKFTGTSASGTYYEQGSLVSNSYTNNQGYRLQYDNSSNKYTFDTYTLVVATTDFNMEGILAEANTHLTDAEFGNYYGNYYCYNGTTMTVNGNTYTNGYVYRLLLGSDGKFYFEHDNLPTARQEFIIASNMSAIQTAVINGVTGSYGEGKIMFVSAPESGTFYGSGLFELTHNSTTGIWYYKTMGGVGNVTCNDSTGVYTYTFTDMTGGQNLDNDGLSRFINIRYVGTDSIQYYSGTGGSEYIVLVARVIGENGGIYERHFSVEVTAN